MKLFRDFVGRSVWRALRLDQSIRLGRSTPMILISRAPAKINLSLHVLGRRPDGYHELESLVAFSGAGDLLTLAPGQALSLTVEGPTALESGRNDDNLVLKAGRALAALIPDLKTGAFHLTKRLPVAAGIGGGSSDAAAALRLLAQTNRLALDDPRILEAARTTGADVPVCLDPRARMMRGLGERLGEGLALPTLVAVLVNPGLKVDTKDVFGRMGLAPGEQRGGSAHPPIGSTSEIAPLMTALRRARNDMEDAAGLLAPVIRDVLAVLAAGRGCRLARMSGSGATCFGLFDSCRAAGRAAKVIRRDHPGWWVKSTVLR